jgi:hypothetical protein
MDHPFAYVSKTLGPKGQGLFTYTKECMAILLVVDHYRPHLQHYAFTVKTGQIHLDNQRLSTPWQHKALTKLLGLTYKIVYKQRYENKVVDACFSGFSRRQSRYCSNFSNYTFMDT